MYNKSRALIEINFNKNYNESMKLLQKAIKICWNHDDIKWKMAFLDRTFRVLNKIVTDFCNIYNDKDNDTMNNEFQLRYQSLYCLLKQNILINISKKQQHIISFWDITYQYMRYVKNRYNEINVIRFQKMIIELWLKYESSPKVPNTDFINFCIDYILCIGECCENLKIEILSKIMQQLYQYIENLNEKIQYKIIINIAGAISSTQLTIKHEYDKQHIHILNVWTKLDCLLQHNYHLFINSIDANLWKLLAKSIRYLPNLIRYIDDNNNISDNVMSLTKCISSCTDKLFNIWYNCNINEISKDKLKNANHRLYDTLITILSILQKYFLQFGDKNKTIVDITDILKLLNIINRYIIDNKILSDPQLCRIFTAKGYNIAVQIYNKQNNNYYQYVLNIIELIQNSCLKFGDKKLAEQCHKLYESATFKCDNMQTVYYKMANNIATCLKQKHNFDISKSYKYLRLLVKYQTHSKNKQKFNNTSSISLIDLLQNVGVNIDELDENIIIQLLSEQLRLYQSSFSQNTTIQQIEILELLLKNYFFNQKSIQRSIALIDLAKLIRISKSPKSENIATPRKKSRPFFMSERNLDNYDDDDVGSISCDSENIENIDPNIESYNIEINVEDRNPLNLLQEAIDLLKQVKKCGADDDEKHLEIMIDDILASAHLWSAICKRESYAIQKAVESQMDDLNQSMLGLEIAKDTNDIDDNDKIGLESMLKALDIWSNLITKQCKTKCKHLSKDIKTENIRECNKCHQCFRDLFSTIQHLQIMLDYMYLNNLVAKEIFILDRMIRLLSTISDNLEWCREYRLLCLCWSGMAYFRFGNSNESKKIFDELQSILLPTTPNISIHVYHHIKIIHAKYQTMINDKKGINTLLNIKQELESKKTNKLWEEMYLLAKIKCILAGLQIKSPILFKFDHNHFSEDIDATTLARDSLIKLISLVNKLNQNFLFKDKSRDKNRNENHHSSTYNAFIDSLPNKRYQFVQASSKQYLSTHHPQNAIHGSHTKMLFHYPSEFRLIAEFLECIQILGHNQLITHQPSISYYQYKNGETASRNLVLYQPQRQFVIDLMRLQSKKDDWDKYQQYSQIYKEITSSSTIKLSSSLTKKMYGGLCKITPYATDYDSNIMRILSIQCIGDAMRYKGDHKSAMKQYQQCLSIIQSLFDAKPIKHKQNKRNSKKRTSTKMDYIPLLKLESTIKRKYAMCLLYLRDKNSLDKCQAICFQLLGHQSILDDLAIAKIKLCIGHCLILKIQCLEIMQIIWRGNNDTIELESILRQNMHQKVANVDEYNIEMDVGLLPKYDTNQIAAVLCIRQHLIQSLLIFIHLNTINPELIKQVSFALAYIYGHTNIKWTAMFLNMAQSVITRQGAIKQYSKQLYDIKQQWQQFKTAKSKHKREDDNGSYKKPHIEPLTDSNVVNINTKALTLSMKKLKLNKKQKKNIFNENDYLTNEQYNGLFTRFYHKLSIMRYHNEEDNNFIDYCDYKCCYKLLDTMCHKFYSQTVEYLQHSWNCILMEVDQLLRTMLICVINPCSTSKNIPTNIVIVDIAINRDQTEIKDEDDENDDGFLNGLYFDENDDNDDHDEIDTKINKKYDNIMSEFNIFAKEAKESTHSGKKCNAKNDIKIWWENRYRLDKKLKNLLQSIQTDILGIFQCVFIPNFRHKQSKKLMYSSCDALVKAINEYLMKKNKQYSSTCYQDKSIKSAKMLLFEKLLQLMLICHSENTLKDDEIKIGLSYIFAITDNHLLNKLLDTVKQQITAIYKKFASKLNLKDFDPMLLSVGDTLKHLPWENIPILQQCLPSISRIPCLEFATLRVIEYSKYDKRNKLLKYYHIINPKGDLQKTQSRFDRLLNDGWNGIKGKIPSSDEFRDGLENNDVFLYVGHNGGEEFVSCSKIETFDIKSVTYLMGCSSGLLKKKGQFQSNGITNYYMIASCPIIVANLWDVTDKDIDQFSCNLLRKSVLKQESIIDIPKAVNLSRSVCKMKYLNGAAPICYGIPFHLFNGIYV